MDDDGPMATRVFNNNGASTRPGLNLVYAVPRAARANKRDDRRVSPGAAQHPPRHALTPLDGRLFTLTRLRFEHQDCWSRRTAGLWVARPPCFQTAQSASRSHAGKVVPSGPMATKSDR